MTDYYAASDEEEAQKAFVGMNWVLTDEHLDVETELALGFLDYLMLGTSASPLRKVSGLPCGLLADGCDAALQCWQQLAARSTAMLLELCLGLGIILCCLFWLLLCFSAFSRLLLPHLQCTHGCGIGSSFALHLHEHT